MAIDIIKQASFILIDEVSMMHKYMLDCLDRFSKVIMNNENVMGGKLMLLVHDFKQILPVIPGGSRKTLLLLQ